MTEGKRVTQLKLELYHLNAATEKERKEVEDALSADDNVRLRYEELKNEDAEIKKRFALEKPPVFTVSRNKGKRPMPKNRIMLIGAAAVLCLCVSAFLYFNSLKSGAVTNVEQNLPEKTAQIIPDKTETADVNNTANTERERIAVIPDKPKEPEPETNNETIAGQTETPVIAVLPNTEQGVYTRGGSGKPEVTVLISGDSIQEQSILAIPPGLTVIFENMFANQQLEEIIIPERITAIGKNAFAGNLLTMVTIGANVTIDDDAIPGNFADAYNNLGKAAGTYIRPSTASSEWRKQ